MTRHRVFDQCEIKTFEEVHDCSKMESKAIQKYDGELLRPKHKLDVQQVSLGFKYHRRTMQVYATYNSICILVYQS